MINKFIIQTPLEIDKIKKQFQNELSEAIQSQKQKKFQVKCKEYDDTKMYIIFHSN